MKKIIRLFLVVLMLACLGTTAAAKTVLKTENGKQYCYINGEKSKAKYGIKIGTKYYRVNRYGVATQVDKRLGLAGIYIEQHGRTLLRSFYGIAQMKYKGTSTIPVRKDAKRAIYGFEKGAGDCNVQAACFAAIAEVLGKKDVAIVHGFTGRRGTKNYEKHAWTTMTIKGAKKVFDPSLAQLLATAGKTEKAKRTQMKKAYSFSYGSIPNDYYLKRGGKALK